ncbi:MAG: ATP-dependent DNA helicase, partial [Nitrospirae bacterium]
MDRYFGKEGILSKKLKGFEYRPQQQDMAQAIRECLKAQKHIIVEAPTGVGKSIAYLIPLAEALTRAEVERAVVATYTKALQRQLVEKDLPVVRENLFPDLKYTVSFGSENYLCLRRLEAAREGGLFDDIHPGHFNALLRWANETFTGLVMEAPVVDAGLWSLVCRDPDLCHHKDCPYYLQCFYQKAKKQERDSQLIVVNHHLYFVNMASGWSILPEFQVSVFDEAHEIEKVASEYLGYEVSSGSVKYLLDSILNRKGKGLLRRLRLPDNLFSRVQGILQRTRAQAETFFQRVAELLGPERSIKLPYPVPVVDILSEHLDDLAEELKTLIDLTEREDLKRDLRAMSTRCRAFVETLEMLLEQKLPDYVYWTERHQRTVKLVATPLEPAEQLRNHLYSLMDTVVLTSATLTVGGNFSFIKQRIGLDEAEELSLPSPFNYRENLLLYIPQGIPEPDTEGYKEAITEEIEKLVRLSDGRTLVLFTSYALMQEVLHKINLQGYELLIQGQRDSYRLVEEFRTNPRTVLCGVYTFWQGIDVPGDALQCVIITRLPFSVPTDPVV